MARRKRAVVKAVERCEATAETLAKLRPCPIRYLHARGVLDDGQRDAAYDIGDTMVAITRCCGVPANDLLRVGGVRELPDWAARWHAERYLPWARDLRCPLGYVLDLILEGDLARVDDLLFRRAVQVALADYVRIKRATPWLDRLGPRRY